MFHPVLKPQPSGEAGSASEHPTASWGAGDSGLHPALPPGPGLPPPQGFLSAQGEEALVPPLTLSPHPLPPCTAALPGSNFSGSSHKDAPVQKKFCPVSHPADNTSHSGGSGQDDGPCLWGPHSALHFLPFLAQSPIHKSTFIGGIGALHLGAKNSIGSFS